MRANAPQLPGGGGMGAAGIDWCINVKPVTPSSLSPCPPLRTREQGSAGRSSIGGFSAWDHVHVKLNGTVMIRRRRITPQTDYPSVSNAKTANV